LARQREPELLEEQGPHRIRVRVAREDELAPVGRRQVYVDHLDRPERVQHRAAGQAGCELAAAMAQRGMQRVGEEGDDEVL
jgi:hypothetical protein